MLRYAKMYKPARNEASRNAMAKLDPSGGYFTYPTNQSFHNLISIAKRSLFPLCPSYQVTIGGYLAKLNGIPTTSPPLPRQPRLRSFRPPPPSIIRILRRAAGLRPGTRDPTGRCVGDWWRGHKDLC
jgi:hypothetical protein